MRILNCTACGASGLRIRDSYYVCDYCNSKFIITMDDLGTSDNVFSNNAPTLRQSNSIALGSDVDRLLQKCRVDRKNARKYANLILDIDPDNQEALKYL